MIRQDISVNGYWDIIVCYEIYLGQDNAGFTHTDFKKKQSIVGIGVTNSKAQLINTIIHEAKHVQSHICRYYNVPEDGEQAAYLIGYIVMRMYNSFKQLL